MTTTSAAVDVLGNAVRIAASVASAGSSAAARASSPGFETESESAGSASASRTPTESAQERAGRRSTRSITAGQNRELVESVCRCGRYGIRPRSMRSPSSSSTAGSTVTEPTTAHATTVIVPLARLLKTSASITNMPAIAIATVAPETTTVRPDVRAVRTSASCEASPRCRSSRERIT